MTSMEGTQEVEGDILAKHDDKVFDERQTGISEFGSGVSEIEITRE